MPPSWSASTLLNRPRLRQRNIVIALMLLVAGPFAIAAETSEQQQLDTEARALKQSLGSDPSNQHLHQRLAHTLYQQAVIDMQSRRLRQAQRRLDEALQHDESAPAIWALMGRIHYVNQQLKRAERAWRTALELDANFPQAREWLQQLEHEQSVENEFREARQARFAIRYSEALPRDAEGALRHTLSEAYRNMGRQFSQYPRHAVTVLLYTEPEFRQRREHTPEWVGGQYDGKIRLPLTADPHSAQFRSLVWHEYAHVIVHELTQRRCPSWLNEGLAEYMAHQQLARQPVHLSQALQAHATIPLDQLSRSFQSDASRYHAELAYEQSFSIVTFLAERYGFWRLKRLLRALGTGTPFEEAFASEFRLTFPDELEEQWLEWAP